MFSLTTISSSSISISCRWLWIVEQFNGVIDPIEAGELVNKRPNVRYEELFGLVLLDVFELELREFLQNQIAYMKLGIYKRSYY